jgi:hypothetical protein
MLKIHNFFDFVIVLWASEGELSGSDGLNLRARGAHLVTQQVYPILVDGLAAFQLGGIFLPEQ